MRIRALSRDQGGCHFYRLQVPLTALRTYGRHDTSWGDWISGDMLNDHDVVVVQFLNGEQDLSFVKHVASVPPHKRPLLVYDVDDDLFTIDEVISHSNKAVLWAQPEVQDRVKRYLGLVDLVTVSTPYLAELYRPYSRKIAVLRNALPEYLLSLHDEYSYDDEPFTVVWTCSLSHLADAREYVTALDKFLIKHPGSRMHWMGPPKVIGMIGEHFCTPWTKNVHAYLQSGFGAGHVGIAPLAPYKFNLGKSGIKADEYAMWGIPTIASRFAQYDDCIEQDVTGWQVRNKWGIYEKLKVLYNNRQLCKQMGHDARIRVATRTINKTWQNWERTYQEAIDEQRS